MLQALKNRFLKSNPKVVEPTENTYHVIIDDPITAEEYAKLHRYTPWLVTLFFDAILQRPGLSSIAIGDITYDSKSLGVILTAVPFIRETRVDTHDPETAKFFPAIPDEQLTDNYASKFILEDPFYYNTITSKGFMYAHYDNIEFLTWAMRLTRAKQGGYPKYMPLTVDPYALMLWRNHFDKEKVTFMSDSDAFRLNQTYIAMLEGIEQVFMVRNDLYIVRAVKAPYGIYLSIDNADDHEVEEIKDFFDGSDMLHKLIKYGNSSWNISDYAYFPKSEDGSKS